MTTELVNNADNNPSVIREPLRWFYTAHFKDGSSIEQPIDDSEDVSQTRTDGTGNRFTDVLAREDELVAFELNHISGNQNVFVDLTTGAFVVNGTPLHVHDQFLEPQKYPLRLVYFRESRIDSDVQGIVLEDLSVNQKTVGVRHYVNRYFIGWQTTVNGKNKQSTVAVG